MDGWLGVQSVTAWQRALDTHVDGVISGQPWECWGNTPNLVAVERVAEPYGSQLVSAVQAAVRADVDGLMGPQMVRCLQGWLYARGYDVGEVDGVLGPRTAKAVRRSLNDGAWSS